MKQATIVRHVAFEDLGSFEPVLAERGYQVRYLEAGRDTMDKQTCERTDLLVVLGGPLSVNDRDWFPFLNDELAVLRQRCRQDRPTLGICFGAQLMAAALGAEVKPGVQGKEIGWFPLTLETGAEDHPIACLSGPEPVFHWHAETFDLPLGARWLASSDRYPHQAFALGSRCLALQFHPEVNAAGLERWYIGHINEICATPGLTIGDLRADANRYAPGLERRCAEFFGAWLSSIG